MSKAKSTKVIADQKQLKRGRILSGTALDPSRRPRRQPLETPEHQPAPQTPGCTSSWHLRTVKSITRAPPMKGLLGSMAAAAPKDPHGGMLFQRQRPFEPRSRPSIRSPRQHPACGKETSRDTSFKANCPPQNGPKRPFWKVDTSNRPGGGIRGEAGTSSGQLRAQKRCGPGVAGRSVATGRPPVQPKRIPCSLSHPEEVPLVKTLYINL